MNALTKYKLTALIFFFVMFAGFILQFIFPYMLDPVITHGPPQLTDNLFILPVIILAAILLIILFALYPKVKTHVKFLPLAGALLMMVLLVTINILNRAQNLDPGTRQKIVDHLQACD